MTTVRKRSHDEASTGQERPSRPRTQIAFRREKRNPIRYQLAIMAADVVTWLVWAMQPTLRRMLAQLIGMGIYLFQRGYRKNLYDNLRHVLGPKANEHTLRFTAHAAFRNSVLNFMDLIITPRRTREEIMGHFGPDQTVTEKLNELRAAGKGIIVMTAHLGPFDIVGQALSVKGFPCTAMSGRTTYRFFFDMVSHWREANGVKVVEPSPTGVREVLRALKRNEVVALVSDRDFAASGRPVTFFGAETTLPPGGVRIARDTGAPILPIFARRLGRENEWRAMDPIWIEKTADVDADVDAGLARVARVLERAIGSAPDQWVIFQRVWPT
jgi:KDO2-lipid IV(A) lauroyltransferase